MLSSDASSTAILLVDGVVEEPGTDPHYSGGLQKPFRHSSLEKMVGHLFLLHDLGSLIFPGLPLMWMHDSLSYEWTLLDAG